MKKVVEIDEKRFVALAELGMPVFWDWSREDADGAEVFEDRDSSEELEGYLDSGGNEQTCTFWTLVEADGHS